MIEFSFERAAMHNEETPAGLSLSERKLYICLRGLYAQYKSGFITREQASKEKNALVKEYERDAYLDKLQAHYCKIIKDVELAVSRYRKERTIENANTVIGIFYGDLCEIPKE